MRAIIIEDKDARSLLDSLALAKLQKDNYFSGDQPATLQDMHRTFHYIVCKWLQDQGASVTRC